MSTNTTRRLLPVSIQDFAKLREGGHAYVDKTDRLYRLISGAEGAYFLSRPRRFGKSLLCSTLSAIFEGKRELFQAIAGMPALAIDSLDWGWKRHPVIRLDLSAEAYSNGVEALYIDIANLGGMRVGRKSFGRYDGDIDGLKGIRI